MFLLAEDATCESSKVGIGFGAWSEGTGRPGDKTMDTGDMNNVGADVQRERERNYLHWCGHQSIACCSVAVYKKDCIEDLFFVDLILAVD